MKRGWSIVSRCSIFKDSKELVDHILIYCDETRALDLVVFQFGLGVLGFSEKPSPRMET